MFTKDHRISDNSVQINIKSTFTVYEYILLSNLIYIYIYIYILSYYIYIYMHICIIYLHIYIYIYMNFMFFIYCNIVANHTHNLFQLVLLVETDGLPNCEHDPSYQ